MACCSPLSEVAAANATEEGSQGSVESTAEVARTIGVGEVPVASNDEKRFSSPGGTNNSLGGGASNDENSWTYNFGTSTITLGRIKEMVEKGYFADGQARAPGAESVPEPDGDEAVVYEDFFVASLRMVLLPALADILLKFQVLLHQLTSNTTAQLSKYFWAIGSSWGIPSSNAFVK
jgi:hypothetical protein